CAFRTLLWISCAAWPLWSCRFRPRSTRGPTLVWKPPCARRCAGALRSWVALRNRRNKFSREAPPIRRRRAPARRAGYLLELRLAKKPVVELAAAVEAVSKEPVALARQAKL